MAAAYGAVLVDRNGYSPPISAFFAIDTRANPWPRPLRAQSVAPFESRTLAWHGSQVYVIACCRSAGPPTPPSPAPPRSPRSGPVQIVS